MQYCLNIGKQCQVLSRGISVIYVVRGYRDHMFFKVQIGIGAYISCYFVICSRIGTLSKYLKQHCAVLSLWVNVQTRLTPTLWEGSRLQLLLSRRILLKRGFQAKSGDVKQTNLRLFENNLTIFIAVCANIQYSRDSSSV